MSNNTVNGYTLSKNWFSFKFDNPRETNARHTELYFYIIDLWNRVGQKNEFGLPTQITMEMLAIGSYNTYKKTLKALVEFGFINIIQESQNQFKAKIISLVHNKIQTNTSIDKAVMFGEHSAVSKNDKALDKPSDKPSDKPLDKPSDKPLDEPIDKPLDTIIEPINQLTIKSINKKEGGVFFKKNIKKFISEKKEIEISFEDFWEQYHAITEKPKTDRISAEKYWNKLSLLEKNKAVFSIFEYSQTEKNNRFLKKARTYLSDKTFYDEFVPATMQTNSNGATVNELAQVVHDVFSKDIKDLE